MSESLDEELLTLHYTKEQEQIQSHQKQFSRHLKVPPINIQTAAKGGKSQSKNRRSPESQKRYSEDVQNVSGNKLAAEGS